MTIQQVYEKYSTPKNLQEHMLRVAALSKIICDNWTGVEINKLEIVKACLLHDIAKPIKFDITKQAAYGVPEDEIKKLDELQKFVLNKFGEDEHKATLGMSKDVGLSQNALGLLDNLEWKYIPRLINEKNIESLIPIYCDMRVGPKGILSLQNRLEDLKNRTSADEYKDNVKNGEILEQRIQEFVSLDLNSIIDENLNSFFPELLNLEI